MRISNETLFDAIAAGEIEQVRELLKVNGDCTVCNFGDENVLQYAAMTGNLEMVTMLLEVCEIMPVQLPLVNAVVGGNITMVEMLLKLGANPNQPLIYGWEPMKVANWVPLQEAVGLGYTDIAEILIQFGADTSVLAK